MTHCKTRASDSPVLLCELCCLQLSDILPTLFLVVIEILYATGFPEAFAVFTIHRDRFNNFCQVVFLSLSKIISAIGLFLSQCFSSRLLPQIAKTICS